MNYLAHAFLSPSSEEILLGNIACDMIKPVDKEKLSSRIREGMALHQMIDRMTDSHQAFIKSRSILIDEGLPYAGVMVDIINDHFLAENWNLYSHEGLNDFSIRIYEILERNSQRIPGPFSRLSKHLCKEDWFGQFKEIEGLKTALSRVNYRSSREIPVPEIMDLVIRKRSSFEEGFHSLMESLTDRF